MCNLHIDTHAFYYKNYHIGRKRVLFEKHESYKYIRQ